MRALVLLALLSGCGVFHNTRRFLAPEEFVVRASDEAKLAEIRYASGWADEPATAYAPETWRVIDGVRYVHPVRVTVDGWIEIVPNRPDTELRLWIRRTGLADRDFFPVVAVTGAVRDRVPQEIRFFEPLDGPVTLRLDELTNVYNDYRLDDGDLVLLEVTAPEGTPERFLFRSRQFGWTTKFSAGLLLRLPVPLVETDAKAATTPALALSVALRFRPRTRRPAIEALTDRVGLVGSVGVGSTVLYDVTAEGIATDQVLGAFNAALVGGGLELFDFLSLQGLVNVSSFTRENEESRWALAVGFDAVQFARFTEDAGSRLLRRNDLPE